VETVTEDGSVVALDNQAVYSTSEDASSWEGDEVAIGEDDSSLTNLSMGDRIEVNRVGDLSKSESYSGSGDTLDSKSSDGSIIVLNDESVWAVESAGQSKSNTWTDSSSITVDESEGASNSYQLVNTDDHESVTANYIGEK
jgi:hypothetical protein